MYIRSDFVIGAVHCHEGGKVRGIVGEEKRGFVTVLGRHEEWEVDATEGDRGQGFTIRVLERKVNCNNHLQDLT